MSYVDIAFLDRLNEIETDGKGFFHEFQQKLSETEITEDYIGLCEWVMKNYPSLSAFPYTEFADVIKAWEYLLYVTADTAKYMIDQTLRLGELIARDALAGKDGWNWKYESECNRLIPLLTTEVTPRYYQLYESISTHSARCDLARRKELDELLSEPTVTQTELEQSIGLHHED